MAASTEVRVPFVDPVVFGAAFALPGPRARSGAGPRRPLREVADDWLPDEIIDRPKASFGAPLRAWVTNDLAPLIDDVLLDGRAGGGRASCGRAAAAPMVADQRSGTAGPVQAAVAAADPGDLVPQRPRRGVGRLSAGEPTHERGQKVR